MTRIVAALILFVSIISNQNAFAGVDHVIVISVDGGKPAALLKSKMPNLQTLVTEGAATFSALTIQPSKTLPSHVSMLTGVSPNVHKVTWNSWNPLKGPVKVPTAFGLAKKLRLSTALFATKDKFKHLEVPGTLDKFFLGNGNAMGVAKAASAYLELKRPNLLFVHMSDIDKAGHSEGWDSLDQLKAFEQIDAAIGVIVKSMVNSLAGKSYALIITADHGGAGKDHGSSSLEDSSIPWITWGNVVRQNHGIVKGVHTMDTAATALWLLGVPVPKSWEGSPVVEAYK